ncbi:hypothetical protein EGJ27_23180 [Pseudomonas sp. v388]|nr:hypothetical protein EGJ27_23180 [Pseudomonas sp. v388]
MLNQRRRRQALLQVELPSLDNAQTLSLIEGMTMTDEKKEPPKEDDTPAHSTEQERERLKDFNKGGIPPGAC